MRGIAPLLIIAPAIGIAATIGYLTADWHAVCYSLQYKVTAPTFTNYYISPDSDTNVYVAGWLVAKKRSWWEGVVCWPGQINCPVGIFVKYKIFDSKGNKISEWRCTDTECTADTGKDIYIPYAFDGSKLEFNITLSNLLSKVPALKNPGTYKICGELWIDVHGGKDRFVGGYCTEFTVYKNAEEAKKAEEKYNASPEKPAETPELPDSAYLKKICKIYNIKIKPASTPIHNQPFNLIVEFNIKCTETKPYGPDVRLMIPGYYTFRIGDQGYTTDMNKNYYFDNSKTPLSKHVTIVLNYLKLPAGIHPVYIQIHYSVKWSSGLVDFEVTTWQHVADIIVKKSADLLVGTPEEIRKEREKEYIALKEEQEAVAKEEIKEKSEYLPLCSGYPSLIYATWITPEGKVITTTKVGETVYAAVKVSNPNDNCIFRGRLCIVIMKDVDCHDVSITEAVYNFVTRACRDIKIRKVCKDVELKPGEEKVVTYEISLPAEGKYHFDVYWGKHKYTVNEVVKFFGNPDESAAGEEIEVVGKVMPKKEDVQKKPTLYLTVIKYWFKDKKTGKDVTFGQVLEGTPIEACVVVQSGASFEGRLTLEVVTVKAPAIIPGMPMDYVAPDAVVTSTTKYLIFEPEKNYTICTEFVARQIDATHNTWYYLRVKYEGKEIGIFPTNKMGVTVIPKSGGKWNPWIYSADEAANIVVVEHGWYTADLSTELRAGQTIMQVPADLAIVVVVQNTGEVTAPATVSIVVRKDIDFSPDQTVAEQTFKLTLEPGEIKQVVYQVSLEEGAYHYEVYINGKKVVSRSPTIYVGIGTSLWQKFMGFVKGILFNPMTIVGTVFLLLLLGLFLFFAPMILPRIMMTWYMIQMLMEMMRGKGGFGKI